MNFGFTEIPNTNDVNQNNYIQQIHLNSLQRERERQTDRQTDRLEK